MANSYKILVLNTLNSDQKKDWLELFCFCFKKSINFANAIYLKYTINKCKFSMIYVGDELVSVYSGIFMQSDLLRVFMSTDTMSNGKVRGGSIIAAKALYAELKGDGIELVCGFPNKKIEGLRKKKLGWRYIKTLNLYIILNSTCATNNRLGMMMNKPARGFFRSIPSFFFLGSYLKETTSLVGIEISSCKPNSPCINLSKYFGIGMKKLYACKLKESIEHDRLESFYTALFDSRSIDVP